MRPISILVLCSTLSAAGPGPGPAQDEPPHKTGAPGGADAAVPAKAQDAEPDQDPFAKDRAEMVRALNAAHRGTAPGTEPKKLDRFRAELRLTPLGQSADTVEFGLTADFMLPRYIRTRVVESGTELERGHDKEGDWARNKQGVYALEGRQYPQDRDELRRHIRLARQMLKYLDPATALAELEITARTREKTMEFGSRLKIACRQLSGKVKEFPLYDAQVEADRVAVELWVDAKTDLLVGVRATPLNDRGQPIHEGELVLLQDYKKRDGVQLPTQLTICRIEKGLPHPIARIRITGLDLEPDLTVESFARPR